MATGRTSRIPGIGQGADPIGLTRIMRHFQVPRACRRAKGVQRAAAGGKTSGKEWIRRAGTRRTFQDVEEVLRWSRTRRMFCGGSRTWRPDCKARRQVPACRQGRGKRIKEMTVACSGRGAPAAQWGCHCRRAAQGAFRHAGWTDGMPCPSLAAGVECRSSHASGFLRRDDIIRDERRFWTWRHCSLRGRRRRIRLGRRIWWRRGTNHADWHHENRRKAVRQAVLAKKRDHKMSSYLTKEHHACLHLVDFLEVNGLLLVIECYLIFGEQSTATNQNVPFKFYSVRIAFRERDIYGVYANALAFIQYFQVHF